MQSSLTHACVACGSTVRVEVVDSQLLESGHVESWRRVKEAGETEAEVEEREGEAEAETPAIGPLALRPPPSALRPPP